MHILQLQMHDLKMLRVLAWLWLPDCCVGFEIDHPLGLIWCLQWSACMQHDCILLRVNGDSAVQWKRCRGPFTWPAWNGSTTSDRWFFQTPKRCQLANCLLRTTYVATSTGRTSYASRTCMLHRVEVFGASFTFTKRGEQETEYSSTCGEKMAWNISGGNESWP